MKKDPVHYVVHIIDMANLIEEFVPGYNKELFMNDKKTNYAVLRCLETMADATQYIGKEIQDHYPNIQWRQIKGFRNIMAHEYLGTLDDNRVWDVIKIAVPILKKAMTEELHNWEKINKHYRDKK